MDSYTSRGKVLNPWNKDHWGGGAHCVFVVALLLLEQGVCFSLVLSVRRHKVLCLLFFSRPRTMPCLGNRARIPGGTLDKGLVVLQHRTGYEFHPACFTQYTPSSLSYQLKQWHCSLVLDQQPCLTRRDPTRCNVHLDIDSSATFARYMY